MFIIRQSQKQALTAALDARAARCVQRRIRRRHPEQCRRMGEDAVRDAVFLAIRKGRGYGLKTKGEFFFFLDLMYRLGFDFDTGARFPWIRSILDEPGVAPHEKLKKIRERLSAEQENR